MKYIFYVLAMFGMAMPLTILADEGRPIDDVLSEIMAHQNVSLIEDISCDQVTTEEFTELGESVMSIMHPDEKIHEQMDAMMGGEGSETLEAAHLQMGQNYLGCGTQYGGYGMMGGMMGPGMMYTNNVSRYGSKDFNGVMGFPFSGSMMHSYYGIGWIVPLVFWGLIISGVTVLVSVFKRKNSSSALGVLKSRYAKGEIDKKKFDEMKKDVS